MIHTTMKQKYSNGDRCECNCHGRTSTVEFCGYCSSSHCNNSSRNPSFKSRANRGQRHHQHQQQTARKTPLPNPL